MHLALLAFALDVANVVVAVLLGLRLVAALRGRNVAALMVLITVGAVAYIVLARDDYAGWIPEPYRIAVGGARPALNLLRNAVPGLFMLLVRDLFSERRRVPAWLVVLIGAQLTLEAPALPETVSGTRAWLVSQAVPTALQTFFVGLAIYWTIVDWRADLVEGRRRARAIFLIVLAVQVIAASLLLRVLIPPGSLANYQAYVALGVANLALLASLLVWLTGVDLGAYLESRPRRPPARPTASGEEAAALARVLALVEGERVYREAGLSLKTLADRAGLPEYRLRRLIHDQLGFRNFNAFLHHHRIAEACAQLCDPDLRRTPILTIALSVGYQSVNTFNRGFREVMGMTPSDYRSAPAEIAPQNFERRPIS